MTDQEMIDRFEELEAGRILGDLDADEVREWEELSLDPRCQGDSSLELIAAVLDSGMQSEVHEALPGGILKALNESKSRYVVTPVAEETVIRPSLWKKIFSDTETAWAMAALFLILFVAQAFVERSPEETAGQAVAVLSPEQSREALVAKAGDLIQSKFGGIESYGQMSGEVVWSDELQEGYMTLTNLPANDPTSKQYQLWIVDPTRDKAPVDGGVFDIPADAVTAVVPIKNPLTVKNPQAFLITLEQPGGVVVSDREVKVALATTS